MTHADLINLWPSLTDFAADIGVQYGTAKAMRRRGSVPAEYWSAMIKAAEMREITGVTVETMLASITPAVEAAE